MGTFGPYNNPPTGNPDFVDGSVIRSEEVDGNYALIFTQLNSRLISDQNITQFSLTEDVIANNTLLDRTLSVADVAGANLALGVGGDKLQNDAVTSRSLGPDSVEDLAVSDPTTNPGVTGISGTKIQSGTLPLSALGFSVPTGAGNVPVGTVQWFAGAAAPAMWVVCDGQELDDTTYSALDSVLGGVYDNHPQLGLPAAGNFRVPDLQSRAIVGTGTNNNLGEDDGLAEASRNSPEHTHTGSVDIDNAGDHQHGAGTYSGSKTGANTGSAFNDASRYETGHIIEPGGASALISDTSILISEFGPNAGGGGVNFTKLNHFHTFNITGITISGSSQLTGDHTHAISNFTVDAAQQPYMALLPIIYTGV